MATRTRRDVWKLSKIKVWEDTLLWYAKAVAKMQERKLSDPTSWRYQAAIHGYAGNAPGEEPADKATYWNQCQHHCWFFLPWHRWYLYYFEAIVAKTVRELGGPAGWSLPYWNYSDASNPDARKLPPAFREEKLPDGKPNPLRVNRGAGNGGANVGSPGSADIKICLKQPKFTAESAIVPRFGGAKVTANNHSGGIQGQLERTPHGSMHGAVGGLMGTFETAGLDPIFWLHHANIDRLWDVWRKRPSGHVDPTDTDWLDRVKFPFHDADGRPVTKTSRGVSDSAALGYVYEDISDPLRGALEGVSFDEEEESPMPSRIPEMIGASNAPVPLTAGRTATEVPLTAPTGPGAGLESVGGAAEPARVIVAFENVTGEGVAQNFAVYVNGTFAGILPTFGVPEASGATEKHPGGGLEYRFDVTEIVQQTGADPRTMRVEFVPEQQEPEPEPQPEAEDAGLESMQPRRGGTFEIGRVSVYLA
ncbi:MAG TPA: tyrosinase family protein [Thermoanaerobaculia bacterium]|nr:tyrosinase family protein [Thermoanaerobaculia bacterium]